MLLRLITVLSLFQFMMLMIAGSSIETALYRSILVFTVLFTVIYLAMFFLNIIRENPKTEEESIRVTNKSQGKKEASHG